MDIASYGAVVATAALILSGLSLWLHYRQHRRADADRQPELDITHLDSFVEHPSDWHMLRLEVRNLDRYSIKVRSVRVVRPKSARLAKYWDVMVSTPRRYRIPEVTSQTLTFDQRIEPAGTSSASGLVWDGGDRAHLEFFASLSSSISISRSPLILEIALSSSAIDFKTWKRRISIAIVAQTQTPSVKTITQS